MAQRGLEYPCLSWANGTLMARRCDVLVLALTSADVSCLTVPYAVDPRLTGAGRRRGRHDVRAATVPTNAGGPGDGLLGLPRVDGGRSGQAPLPGPRRTPPTRPPVPGPEIPAGGVLLVGSELAVPSPHRDNRCSGSSGVMARSTEVGGGDGGPLCVVRDRHPE